MLPLRKVSRNQESSILVAASLHVFYILSGVQRTFFLDRTAQAELMVLLSVILGWDYSGRLVVRPQDTQPWPAQAAISKKRYWPLSKSSGR